MKAGLITLLIVTIFLRVPSDSLVSRSPLVTNLTLDTIQFSPRQNHRSECRIFSNFVKFCGSRRFDKLENMLFICVKIRISLIV